MILRVVAVVRVVTVVTYGYVTDNDIYILVYIYGVMYLCVNIMWLCRGDICIYNVI